MRTEAYAVIGDFAKFGQTKNLVTAGIGEHRTVPGHEFMQSAQSADQFMAGTKIEVVGIAENNLRTEFFQSFVAQRLHSSLCAHRHEERSIDRTVRSIQDSVPGSADIRFANFKREVHS